MEDGIFFNFQSKNLFKIACKLHTGKLSRPTTAKILGSKQTPVYHILFRPVVTFSRGIKIVFIYIQNF